MDISAGEIKSGGEVAFTRRKLVTEKIKKISKANEKNDRFNVLLLIFLLITALLVALFYVFF
jgi:hypothetical protein